MDAVKPTIYLDLDGVLADFDQRAGRILGTDNIYKWEFIHGAKAFWDKLNQHKKFFEYMEPKEDAYVLWDAVASTKPVILTALPKKDATDVDEQKRLWCAKHLDPDVKVITCETSDKPLYCKPGDILVDDRAVNRAAWLKAGGTYILHTEAKLTVAVLRALGAIN
ncbi:hypothetical protein NKI59_11780 [Mesorhizobium sp. M0598]|uniref:hypothetical protein n=1 Tax=Mesorhizobium sp. M0598 TaxID=2956968 RepID=UPI00333BAAEB